MSPRTKPKRAYHHGDLRRVLLEASVSLIGEGGVGALSMREVARRAGVTHGAPYHHFPDRAAILAAIAEEGFRALARMLRSSIDAIPDSQPRRRFEAAGEAYIRFATANPAQFRVMFRPELTDPDSHPSIEAAAFEAFEILVACVTALQAAGQAPPGDPLPLVLLGWSTAHGFAALSVDGAISRPGGFLCRPTEEWMTSVCGALGRLFESAGQDGPSREPRKRRRRPT